MKTKSDNNEETKAINYEPLLCGVISNKEPRRQSENWKDCPKCGLEMTYGKLITNEWYCWNCNHKGNY